MTYQVIIENHTTPGKVVFHESESMQEASRVIASLHDYIRAHELTKVQVELNEI